jgi:hypothetical protein
MLFHNHDPCLGKEFAMPSSQSASTTETAMTSRRDALRLAVSAAIAAGAASHLRLSAWAQTTFPTRVRVLHASPELGQVEVLFNGNEELDEFDYGQTSDWITVDPGVLRMTIRRDRAGMNYVVYDNVYPVAADEDYDLVISDPLVIPVPVDRGPLRGNTFRVRMVHASIDTPTVDIALVNTGAVDAEAVGTLNYAEATAPMVLPARAYDLEVRVSDTEEVLLALPATAFDAGKSYNLILYGKPGDEDAPLTLAVLADEVHTGEASATPSP